MADGDSTAELTCDVVVAGSGAAGFTAAITAKILGLEVVMVEKAPRFGGTTARSGGIPWVPGNKFQQAAGGPADPERARVYLRNELGNRYDEALIEAYLASGPEMIDFLEHHGAVAFKALAPFPDYHSEIDGAATGGRGVRPLPYDGRRLGRHFDDLEWPIRETMLFGGMMINSEHMPHYYAMTRSPRSFLFVMAQVARYVRDRITHKRGTDLASGNALIARFAEKAIALGIPIMLSTPVVALVHEGDRVAGVDVTRDGKPLRIHARRGVVMATGGFSRDKALRVAHFPANAANGHGWSLTTEGVSGDAARMVAEAGGGLNADMAQPATWLPMSLVPGEGSSTLFPHLVDRNKPGVIAVNQDAARFVNESVSYQDFVPPLIETLADQARQEAYLVADHTALRKYGLGVVRPAPAFIGKWLKNGYLVRAGSLAELARKLDLDPNKLVATVTRFNVAAAKGEDPEFGRGTTSYQRAMGDWTHPDHPSLAPIVTAPFYAVRIVPGDIGTSIGIHTDADARVLDEKGAPMAGLYAAGNDMANPTAGVYPGPGVTLGPAMTFGYRAARHLAAEAV